MSLLSENKAFRKIAAEKINLKDDESIKKAFSTRNGWNTISLVGKKENIQKSLIEELNRKFGYSLKVTASSTVILKAIQDISETQGKDGTIIVIDELGKYLEFAAQTQGDVYFFQELAEQSRNTKTKTLILGILHQAFEQYASKLGRDTREEWGKIQGRYVDIPLVTQTHETLELIGNAIVVKGDHHVLEKKVKEAYRETARSLKERRPQTNENFENLLLDCYPLSPVVATILGPVSKRKFGQNERSIFSFLASAEPFAFSEYLLARQGSNLYEPDRFFDYLKANLDQAILASSDGHRWAQACEAVSRVESRESATTIHLYLIKTIALLDLFRMQSGLHAEQKLLCHIALKPQQKIKEALEALMRWSVIIFKKHLNAFAIFSGSDFDIEEAINDSRASISKDVLSSFLTELNFPNIVAKKALSRKRDFTLV